MASIYDYQDGSEITVGLQGSSMCDQAARAAGEIARRGRRGVVLEDDDGLWYFGPRGGMRRLTRQEMFDGGYMDATRESELER